MGLDIYELVLEVEEEFDIKISDADGQRIESIGDLFDVTLDNLRRQHPESSAVNSRCEDDAWERLKGLLVDQLGLRPEQVVKSARFFHELGFR